MRGTEALASGLLLLGGLASLAGLALVLWLRLGPRKPPFFPPAPPPKAEPTARATGLLVIDDPIEEPTMTETPLPTERPPFVYDGIDLGWAEDVNVAFAGVQLMRPFQPHVWKPELDRDIFAVGSTHALAWEDDHGRIGLWVHSGDDQVASPLQDFIERDNVGYLVTYEVAETRLEDLRGTGVQIQQGSAISRSMVAAAVRVPPLRVNEVESHVGDLVEYLAKTYPGTGFDVLAEDDEALIFYFCGLRLGGEEGTKGSYWTQARFIIAIVPEEGS